MNLRDIEAQAKALAPILRDYVAKAVESVSAAIDGRMSALEKAVNDKIEAIPEPKDGKDGIDGKDAEAIPLETVETMVSEAVKSAFSVIPVPKDGENGKDGLDGKDADAIPYDVVEKMVADAVEKAIAALPVAKDGKDGLDALQIDIKPRIDDKKSYERGTFATHNGGLWRAHSNTDGMHGWECIVDGVCAVDVEQVNERNIHNVVKMASGASFVTPIALPAMIYRHVWREGQYQKGDVVTWGGCAWHCNEDTDTKPGEGAKDWTLMVKKGRDGKSA